MALAVVMTKESVPGTLCFDYQRMHGTEIRSAYFQYLWSVNTDDGRL